jgi:hypothetical protein
MSVPLPPRPPASPIPIPPATRALVSLPSPAVWKKLSCAGSPVGPPFRRADPILVRIDSLVESLQGPDCAATRRYLLCELWFATTLWINQFQQFDPGMKGVVTSANSSMAYERRPAILSLLLYTANTLGTLLECGVGGLAAKLTQIYGKGMGVHGFYKDATATQRVDPNTEMPTAQHYMRMAVRDNFRIRFIDKLAYLPNRMDGGPLVLLDTEEKFYDTYADSEKAGMRSGWNYFVMSMSRELYMGRHSAGGQGTRPQYHSSYLAGMPIQCGGSMHVEKGRVTGLRNDSGHYQPVDESLAKVLELLKTMGVDISQVLVHSEVARAEVKGDVFLVRNGNWDAIRRTNCTPMWREFSSGKKTLHQLVSEYFDAHRAALVKSKEPNIDDQKLWTSAYQAVCWDLALYDLKWKSRASSPPIPRARAVDAAKVT